MIYKGRIAIVGGTDDPLPVNCEVTDNRLLITTGDGSVIGDWGLGEISAIRTPEGFVLRAEGENLLLAMHEPDAFMRALGTSELSHIANQLEPAKPQPATAQPHRDAGPRTPLRPHQASEPDADVQPRDPTATSSLAAASLIAGVAGIALLFAPFVWGLAIAAGAVAVILGILAIKRSRIGRQMAIGGIVLGCVAVLFAGWVAVDIAMRLDDLGSGFDSVGQELVDRAYFTLEGCHGDGATGYVTNGHSESVDIFIEAQFYGVGGTVVHSSNDWINSLRPGDTATWEASIYGTDYSQCRAWVSSVYES